VLALQAHLFSHGEAAALFFHLVAESKAAQFRLDYGPGDIAAAFFDVYIQLCRMLAVVEDVLVHQASDQLRGSAATPH